MRALQLQNEGWESDAMPDGQQVCEGQRVVMCEAILHTEDQKSDNKHVKHVLPNQLHLV